MRKICAFEKLKAVHDGVRKLRYIFVLQDIIVLSIIYLWSVKTSATEVL